MNTTQIAKLFLPLGFRKDSTETTKGAKKIWLRANKSYSFDEKEILTILKCALGKTTISVHDSFGEVEFTTDDFAITWQPEYRTLLIAVFRTGKYGLLYSLGVDC